MKAYIHTKAARPDGTYDSYLTQELHVKRAPMPHHGFTASGYGARIPTEYMIMYNRKWRRVYCLLYSNSGTLYIGKKYTPCLTVSIEP